MDKTWVWSHPFVSNTVPRNGSRGTLVAGAAVSCLRTQQLTSCPFVFWSWNNIKVSHGHLSPIDSSVGIYLPIVRSHQSVKGCFLCVLYREVRTFQSMTHFLSLSEWGLSLWFESPRWMQRNSLGLNLNPRFSSADVPFRAFTGY